MFAQGKLPLPGVTELVHPHLAKQVSTCIIITGNGLPRANSRFNPISIDF